MDIKDRYIKTYIKYNGGIKSLRWQNYKAAAKRYKQIVNNIPSHLSDFNILDIGCGFGDIIPFLSSKFNSYTYTGLDIIESFTEDAKKRFPDKIFNFICRDYFENPLDKQYDLIVCSGALNYNYPNALDDRKKKDSIYV